MNRVHIFVDSSNIWGCGQQTAKRLEPHVPWQAFRLYYRNLFQLVLAGRKTGTRMLGGSIPPASKDLWSYAHREGFNTSLLRRVERDDGRMGEQGVDEILHKRILETLLDNPCTDSLIVMTGDGGRAEFGDGFVSQIERGLKLGWKVELWSWIDGRHPRYQALHEAYPDLFSIHELDPHYWTVTFVQEGTYWQKSASGVPFETVLQGRIVSPLRRGSQQVTPVVTVR